MRLKIGTADGGDVFLYDDDLRTHLYGVGKSQRGKSRLLARIVRELIIEGEGLCLIDPHGSLYAGVIQWLAYARPQLAEIVLLDPSHPERVTGFNPFTLESPKTEARITTKVDRMVDATLKVWGEEGNAPLLSRWLRCLYYVMIEQDYPLEIIRAFRGDEHAALRDEIIRNTRSDLIREELEQLTKGKQAAGQLESSINRIFRIIFHPTVRRITGVRENSLSVREIVSRGHVLLANLQESDVLSRKAGETIGTLLLSEIVSVFAERRKKRNFFVIVDEFQTIATPDFPRVLDELAKYGLHLIICNQRLATLDTETRSAIRNTDTKVIFSGVARSEVAELLEGSNPPEDLLDRTLNLPVQHFTLRCESLRPTVVRAATTHVRYVSDEEAARYVAERVQGYMTHGEVDARLKSAFQQPEAAPSKPQNAILEAPAPYQPESPSTQIFSNAPAKEISDDDLFE
jgi:hypothetical protein